MRRQARPRHEVDGIDWNDVLVAIAGGGLIVLTFWLFITLLALTEVKP